MPELGPRRFLVCEPVCTLLIYEFLCKSLKLFASDKVLEQLKVFIIVERPYFGENRSSFTVRELATRPITVIIPSCKSLWNLGIVCSLCSSIRV
jgi:hypothetical protein